MQWAHGTIFHFHCCAKYICILWYIEEATMVLKRTWDDIVGKGTCHKSWRSKFNSHGLCYGRWELIPELCALASPYMAFSTHPHIQKINKLGKEEKEMEGGRRRKMRWCQKGPPQIMWPNRGAVGKSCIQFRHQNEKKHILNDSCLQTGIGGSLC